MNKLLIPIAVILMASTSCNKEFTCVCENSTWRSEDPIKSFSKSEAKVRCESESEDIGRPDRVICTLK
ncbi:MAG: hypothetical protein H6551_07650 [Chitinophagales bacterium]|nr:hypothetical protein [Chitinophagaceae bacterium]MCB9065004.1 hypothetical protein [Chitinophagales bacterium]